jgi:DNA-binding GntR family transcriptional regulator
MVDIRVDLDRSSSVPLHQQLAREFERAIADGSLPPGTRLPNEVSLAGRFGLSRPTMRQAIRSLVAKGLLVRKRGVGTQVMHGGTVAPTEVSSLFDDLSRNNANPATKVLSCELLASGVPTGDGLDLPSSQPVLYVRRLRLSNGEPFAIMENYLPGIGAEIEPSDLEARGLYEIMRSRGVNPCVANQRIGARQATIEECDLLKEDEGSPVLTEERTTYDHAQQIVEWARHVYRPSLYSFGMTLIERHRPV